MFRIESDVNIKSKSNENNRLRKSSGLAKQTLERISAERAEIERAEKEQSLYRFEKTGQYQKVDEPAIDWQTKQEIPVRMTTKFRFQCYDITDPNNISEASIWERGRTEQGKILWYLS